MKKITIEEIRKRGESRGLILVSTIYENCFKKIDWKCVANGHMFPATVANVSLGHGCPDCFTKKVRTSIEKVRSRGLEFGYVLLSKKYGNNKEKLDWKCLKLNHIFKMSFNFIDQNHGCPECMLMIHGDDKRLSIEYVRQQGLGKGYYLNSDVYLNNYSKLNWSCKEEWHNFQMSYGDIREGHGCSKCASFGPSKPQLEIYEYFKSLLPGENVDLSTRKLIPPKEIDIYHHLLAMEYNGLYHHSSAIQKERGRERNKALACHALGVPFFMIFGDEWKNKQELVKAMIRYRLGKFEGVKLYARKCELRKLTSREVKEFFNRNHLDGNAKCSWAYGLFHSEKLIMCASVRKNFNKEIEIARLATDYDYSVSGGASRLIKAIFNNTEHDLVSYSNNRLSSGGIYQKLGFKEITASNAPSYYYTDFKERVWRFKCKRINDPKILAQYPTEVAQALGGVFSQRIWGDSRPLYRIEDCGHKKWILRK